MARSDAVMSIMDAIHNRRSVRDYSPRKLDRAAVRALLAACSMGLGSCVIGSALPALNNPGVITEIGIPAGFAAVAPIIVGHPNGETPPTSRKEPKVLAWK